MTRKKALAIALALIAVGCVVCGFIMWEPAIAPIPKPSEGEFSELLKAEGQRIVALGDCVVCHTAKDGKPFAGGLPLLTPFGTIYATNITPDTDTGIGSWSLPAFSRALRRGIARDGHQIYPAFPYIHFTRISDHDIEAAYAYLMTREPVAAKAPPNQLIFPLNFRPPVAFWNLMFLWPGERPPDQAKDASWNRGKLLVDGLGHCSACHSPLNFIGGEKLGRAFDGGIVDGWEAPALNELNRAVVPWTKEQLITYLRTAKSIDHGTAAGPMLPVVRDLATVPDSDVDAIATYILSIQKPLSAAVPEAHPAVASDQVRHGEILFTGSCAQCHGPSSPMQSIGMRPSLSVSTAVNAHTPRNLVQMIVEGVPWHGEDTLHYMPTFSEWYSPGDIADLAAYVRFTYSRRPAWTDLPDSVERVMQDDHLK